MAEVKSNLMPLSVKLKIVMHSPVIVFRGIKYLLRVAFSSGPRRSLKRTLAVAISRALSFTIGPLTGITANHLPTTGEAVRHYCTSNKLGLHAVTVSIPTSLQVPCPKLHIVTLPMSNTSNTNRVLLYFHGGGYRFPLPGAAHMDFALRLATAANASSLAILEYGLAPGLQHPGQLIQAIEALRHLLRSPNDRGAGYNASEIVLFGDSAGGNMVAGVLAHLRYASPYAEPVEFPGRIGAAVMLSPWVSMRHDEDSYVKNAGWDTIDVAGGQDSRAQWQPKEGDRFADMLCDSNALKVGPENAGEFWASVFRGEDKVVRKTVILVGEDEIIFDDVVRFGKMAMAKRKIASQDENTDGEDSVMLVQCPGETHCGAILDVIAGVDTTKCMLAELLAWLKEV